jgi:hypothetical protein
VTLGARDTYSARLPCNYLRINHLPRVTRSNDSPIIYFLAPTRGPTAPRLLSAFAYERGREPTIAPAPTFGPSVASAPHFHPYSDNRPKRQLTIAN